MSDMYANEGAEVFARTLKEVCDSGQILGAHAQYFKPEKP